MNNCIDGICTNTRSNNSRYIQQNRTQIICVQGRRDFMMGSSDRRSPPLNICCRQQGSRRDRSSSICQCSGQARAQETDKASFQIHRENAPVQGRLWGAGDRSGSRQGKVEDVVGRRKHIGPARQKRRSRRGTSGDPLEGRSKL